MILTNDDARFAELMESRVTRCRPVSRRSPDRGRPVRVSAALFLASMPGPLFRRRSTADLRRPVDAFSVEHSFRNVKHRALSRRFLRRFSCSRIATLRVSLRVTTFYATHRKHSSRRSGGSSSA